MLADIDIVGQLLIPKKNCPGIWTHAEEAKFREAFKNGHIDAEEIQSKYLPARDLYAIRRKLRSTSITKCPSFMDACKRQKKSDPIPEASPEILAKRAYLLQQDYIQLELEFRNVSTFLCPLTFMKNISM